VVGGGGGGALCPGRLAGLQVGDLVLELGELLPQLPALPFPLLLLLADVAVAISDGLEGLGLPLLALQHLRRTAGVMLC